MSRRAGLGREVSDDELFGEITPVRSRSNANKRTVPAPASLPTSYSSRPILTNASSNVNPNLSRNCTPTPTSTCHTVPVSMRRARGPSMQLNTISAGQVARQITPSTPKSTPVPTTARLAGNKRPRHSRSYPNAKASVSVSPRHSSREEHKEEEEPERTEASEKGIPTWQLRRLKYLSSSSIHAQPLPQIQEQVNEFASPHCLSLGGHVHVPSLSNLCALQIRANAQAGKLTYKTLPNEFVLCDAYLFQILCWPGLSARILSRLEFKDVRLGVIECLWAYFVHKHYQIERLPDEFESWRAVHEHKEMSLRESVQKLQILNTVGSKHAFVNSAANSNKNGTLTSRDRDSGNCNVNISVGNVQRPRTIKIDNRIRYHRTQRTFPSSSSSASSSAFYNTATNVVQRTESILQRLRHTHRNKRRRR